MKRIAVLIGAATLAVSTSAFASPPTWDTSAAAGITSGTGTWDFNTTSNWTTNGGATNVKWTNNGDSAIFQLTGAGGTVTIGGANQVGAAGISISANGGAASNIWAIAGNSINLGAGGISNSTNILVALNAPLVLTSSQPWTSNRTNTNNGVAGITVNGAISTLSGSTNLTFDGQGLGSPTSTANGDQRVIFALKGANTFVGTTTVTGGAHLRLDFTASNASKLDDNSALILGGGTLSLSGNSLSAMAVEAVASTTMNAGANTIISGPNGGGGTTNRILLGALTHNTSGTIDVTNAVSNLAFTTTQNGTGNIIGGWATVAGNGWAVGSSNGSSTAITSLSGSGTSRSSDPNTWGGSTENVNVTSASATALTASKTINSLRVAGATAVTADLGTSTLTVGTGGIIGTNANGAKIDHGKIVSGMTSGELFVHTPSALTISSEIADNSSIPGILVKGGASTLTLTGANTYTGATYVNAGTLQLDGSLANSNITITGGTLTGSGTLTYRLTNNVADLISVSAIGGLNIANLNFNLVRTGTQTLASEYVIADKAAASTYVSGSSFLSAPLPGGWSIDYDGTASHPGEIVLLAPLPEPSSFVAVGFVGAMGLMFNRRRK